MATTSLWAVRGNIRDVVAYVKDPNKTANPDYDLQNVLNYAVDNAIFIYNDRIIFTFNYKSDAKTVLFSELNSSDITSGVRPVRRFITDLRFSFIFSQILAKSRVFVIYIMGLFFPA